MNGPGWPGLAEAVTARRVELGLSVRAIVPGSGISRTTWIAIEEGSRRLSRHLWGALERRLGWATGSVQAIINGGEATPIEATASPAAAPMTTTSESTSGGRVEMDLSAEVDRIKSLDVDTDTKIMLVQAIVELYEQRQRERAQART